MNNNSNNSTLKYKLESIDIEKKKEKLVTIIMDVLKSKYKLIGNQWMDLYYNNNKASRRLDEKEVLKIMSAASRI